MRSVVTLLISISVCVVGVSLLHAAGSCEQTFTVFSKTEGDHSLLVYKETVGGDCIFTVLHFLFLEPDTIWTFQTEYAEEPRKATNLPHFRDLGGESFFKPIPKDGKFVLNDSMSIEGPAVDTTFLRRFGADEIGMGVPSIWYRKCKTDCLDEPVLSFRGELIYHHQRGVYKNYHIKTVWYWEESGYILIQTENPNKATGLDTMHGMLLYRVGNQ